MSIPRAVLWDLDGTLIDSEPYWLRAEYEVVEAAGGQWSDELGLQLVGNDLLTSANFIRARTPVSLPAREVVDALIDSVVAQLSVRIPWRPGACELLAQLVGEGVPCALVTMSWSRLATAVVSALPVGSFQAVVTGDEVSKGKPDPECYLTAAAQLGVAPLECLAIEDSATGSRAATAAGVPTLVVPHVVPVPDLVGSRARPTLQGMTVSDLADIRAAAARDYTSSSSVSVPADREGSRARSDASGGSGGGVPPNSGQNC